MRQIIVFALFMGIGITLVGQRAKPVESFFDGLTEVTYKIVNMIIEVEENYVIYSLNFRYCIISIFVLFYK